MTWFETKTSASSSSTSAVSERTQRSNPSGGSPVRRRTKIEVSMPKRAVMLFLSKRTEVEGPRSLAELRSQGRQTRPVDPPRTQHEPVGYLLDLEPVSRPNAQRLQDSRRK